MKGKPRPWCNLFIEKELSGEMIISIHQPQYMPWLGYFDKIARSDVFVLLDDVQFKKNEWQNRNQIKTAQGKQWITVPVMYHFPERINEVKINNTVTWQKKQQHGIELSYRNAPFYKEYKEFLDELFSRQWGTIDTLNIVTVKKLARLLGIKTEIVSSSAMKIVTTSTRRLIDICKKFSADTYIAGQGGEQYMEIELFKKENIDVIIQKYEHPVYPQLYGEFISQLSVIDLLFNCGDKSLAILRGDT